MGARPLSQSFRYEGGLSFKFFLISLLFYFGSPFFPLIWYYPKLMQLASHLHFFMELIKIAEMKVTMMGEKVTNAKKELSEAKIWAFQVEKEFQE